MQTEEKQVIRPAFYWYGFAYPSLDPEFDEDAPLTLLTLLTLFTVEIDHTFPSIGE